jgi:hypothetical protein
MKPQDPAQPKISLLLDTLSVEDRKRNDAYFAEPPRDRVLRDVAAANALIRKRLAEQQAAAALEKTSKK